MPRSLAICLTYLALLPSLTHGATNLIANPRFDAGITGWHKGVGDHVLSWSPLDESGKPASGSLRMTNLESSLQFAWSDCFPVTPGAPIVFGGSAYSPAWTFPFKTFVRLRLSNAADCYSVDATLSAAPEDYYFAASTWGSVQGNGVVPAGVQSAQLTVWVNAPGTVPTEVLFDNVYVYEGESCVAAGTLACLNDRRFRVSAVWEIPDGTRGYAQLVPFTGDSLRATFFNPANVELVLKVLDGRPVNDHFWLFAAGLTSVEVKLRVTDTQTGEVWTHTNPLDQAFSPVQDVSAFADEVH